MTDRMLLAALTLALTGASCRPTGPAATAENETLPDSTGAAPYATFGFDLALRLPGTPEALFDAVTGDISDWWDHSFSETPYRFYIEPRPGGGFYELFDAEGNGVLHATVIVADRGKMLRFDGPLGLSGQAIHLVTTYTFAPAGSDSTDLGLQVRGAGEVRAGIPEVVEDVWRHFLFERLKPHVETGRPLPAQ